MGLCASRPSSGCAPQQIPGRKRNSLTDCFAGNILCAPNPRNPSHPEVILIDHGLYVELPEAFRHEYCLLWQSLFTGNVSEIENIAVKWGIRRQNSDIFASLTLLRPHRLRKKREEDEARIAESGKTEQQVRLEQRAGLKERLKTMLESEELIPRVSSDSDNFRAWLILTCRNAGIDLCDASDAVFPSILWLSASRRELTRLLQ